MKCHACQTRIPKKERTCPNCGTDISFVYNCYMLSIGLFLLLALSIIIGAMLQNRFLEDNLKIILAIVIGLTIIINAYTVNRMITERRAYKNKM